MTKQGSSGGSAAGRLRDRPIRSPVASRSVMDRCEAPLPGQGKALSEMSTETAPSSASQHYEEAHAIHYEERNLLRALGAYCRVIASFPNTPEAEHSRTQLWNIVSIAVPANELLSSQTELALRHLQSDGDATGLAMKEIVPMPT